MSFELYNQIKLDLKWFIRTFAICYIVIVLILSFIPVGLDSTDDGTDRSGMALRIDNMTGCHYLEGTSGGMIQRFDAEGNHICTGQED